MNNWYHTERRPTDKNGNELKPLDLVILGDVPSHYWTDPSFSSLKHYKGCYGLVSYYESEGEGIFQPFYHGNRRHPGWLSEDGKFVNVLTRRIVDGAIWSADFWMPVEELEKIPFNVLIMNIFSEYPWQMLDSDGPSSYPFIVEGMPEFEHIEAILKSTYEDLAMAHQRAMEIIKK